MQERKPERDARDFDRDESMLVVSWTNMASKKKRSSRSSRRPSSRPSRGSRRHGNANAAAATADQLEEVVRFAKTLRTWMHANVDEDRLRSRKPGVIDPSIEFATRENGDVGSERAGRADLAEGLRVAKAMRKKFPGANVDMDVVDEWVSVTVDFRSKRYKSKELARALQTAFPNIGEIREMGGTWEIAVGGVPGIGAVRLVSGMSRGGLTLDHSDTIFAEPSQNAVHLEGLEPRAIQAAASMR